MGKSDKTIHMRYEIQTERVDLFDVNIVITMLVRINGEIGYDKLNKAFQEVCQVHEVLNLKVVIDPDGEAHYISNDKPLNRFSETTLDLEGIIASEEKRRFLIEKGEFIRGFKSYDGIVFMMHHLGGDGRSLLYFIETFFKILNGEKVERIPFRNLLLKDLPESSRLPFYYGPLISSWNKKWDKMGKIFDYSDMDKAYEKFWKDHKTKTTIRTYDKDELDMLLESARKSKVSLTSYLITDYLKDMPFKAEVGIAVDERNDKIHFMGNQVTGISLKYRYDNNLSFDDNARNVQKLLKGRLSDKKKRYLALQFMGNLRPSLRDALNLNRAGYYKDKFTDSVASYLGYGDKIRDLSVTNLMRVDIPLEYGPYKIDEIIFVPPVVAYAKNVIGIITTGDKMNIATHVCEGR